MVEIEKRKEDILYLSSVSPFTKLHCRRQKKRESFNFSYPFYVIYLSSLNLIPIKIEF